MKLPVQPERYDRNFEQQRSGIIERAIDSAGGKPGGADNQLQYNSNGVLGGSPDLVYDPADEWYGPTLKFHTSSGGAQIVGIADNSSANVNLESYNTSTSYVAGMANGGGPWLYLLRGRGSWDTPSAVLANDSLGMVYFGGYRSAGAESVAQIDAQVKDVGTYIGANLVFATKTSVVTNPQYRMRIDADGGMVLRASVATDPTGGSKGAGTINAAGLYVNGVAVSPVNGYTVSTLPSAGTVGRQAYVTDGDAALAWGATVVNSGAGATKYLCWDNGTNWTVVGK